MKNKIFILTFLFSQFSFGQYVNIVSQLQEIEAGNIEDVRADLDELKEEKSGDPNVIFLEAVMTEDGEKSKNLYEVVYNDFPKSPFADAALFLLLRFRFI